MLDLDPEATNAERMICRLAYENAQLVSQLARAGLRESLYRFDRRVDSKMQIAHIDELL